MGPYYFAWCDASETVFGDEHVRNDEPVFNFRINHTEGNFPTMDVVMRNPGVGLLAPGRKRWAWFSKDMDGDTVTESESEPGVRPLFFGRLLGYPVDMVGSVVTLNFTARPVDYAAQQEAVAATKRVRPYWDAIWFDPKDAMKPDNVLESRPELWHVDRITHEVTTSNTINGEDGLLTFDGDNTYYDSLVMGVSQTPVRRVELIAAVGWEQVGFDSYGVDFSDVIGKAARVAGASIGGFGNTLGSYTGPGLQESWPKAGANVDGGWSVAAGSYGPQCVYNAKAYFDNWPTPGRMSRRGGSLRQSPAAEPIKTPNPGYDPASALAAFEQSQSWFHTGTAGPLVVGYNSPYQNWVNDVWGGPGRPAVQTGTGAVNPLASGARSLKTKLWVPRWDAVPELRLAYDVKRTMKETVSITLEADMQAILVEPGDEEVIQISMESGEVVTPVDPGGLMPIGDLRNRTYFASTRGAESIEYLLAVARAQLLSRSRAITVTFQTDFDTGAASDLSCRKQATLEDYRLPGGIASGKVIDYTLSGDGDSGKFECAITIGCAVGQGNTVSGAAGSPVYVSEGYVQVSDMLTGAGYQRYAGAFVVPIPGELYYGSIIGQLPNDDGVDFARMDARDFTINCTITNGWREQEALLEIGGGAGDPSAAIAKLNEGPTTVSLELRPLTGGPFETTWEIATSLLMVPKMIDLEAA